MTNIRRCPTVSFSFFCLCASAFLFVTCNYSPVINEEDEDFFWADVEYSKNTKGVTLYLDENGRNPPASDSRRKSDYSRALSLSLAQFSHDYFEVVFLYRPVGGNSNGSDDIVARASWEIGESAGVSGIHRTPGGINYGLVGSGGISAGNGYAVLFVGRKADKTLLAVGTLSHVDGVSGAMIKNDTKSVTFTLDALKTGVSGAAAQSDFKTAAGDSSFMDVSNDNTRIIPMQVAARIFPLFRFIKMSPNVPVRANYTFNVNSGSSFDNYRRGIIVSSPGTVEVIEPRYTIGQNVYKGTALLHDKNTIINIVNNLTAGAAFANPVEFTFNVAGTVDASVLSFVFHMPVHALTSAVDVTGGIPTQWYLRPGYDTGLYDLDDGNGGIGGAILIGTGEEEDLQGYVDYRLVVIKPPNLIFTGSGTFSLNGTEIKLLTAEGHLVKTVLQNDSNLEVYINGEKTNDITASASSRHVIVELRYSYNGKTYSDFLTAWVQ